ncbi:MAG: hypothetical protein AAGH79_13185 [Bacteroidota bacterium]
MKYIIPFSFVLFCALGCNELELPEPVEEPSIFELAVSWSDGVQEVYRGEDKYLLEPRLEKAPDGIADHTTRYSQQDCLEACAGTWEIIFRNPNVIDANVTGVLAGVSTWPYQAPLVQDTQIMTSYRADLEAVTESSGMNSTLRWRINGEEYNQDDQTITLEYDSLSGPLEVCLELESNNLNSYQCRRLELTENQSIHAQIRSDGTPALEVLYTDITGGVQPYQATWSTGASSDLIIPNSPGEYCLEAVDNVGITSEQCVYYTPGQGVTFSAAFDYEVHRRFTEFYTTQGDPQQLGTMTIIYTDSNGIEYRSDRESQPSSSYFRISDGQSFAESFEGLPVWQVAIEFLVHLYPEEGTPLMVDQAQGTWAFAYE